MTLNSRLPKFRHPLQARADVEDFPDDRVGYVTAVLASIDARPLSDGTTRVSAWALRRAFPSLGRFLARIAVGAVDVWDDAHGGAR